jgi:hypothetical protein
VQRRLQVHLRAHAACLRQPHADTRRHTRTSTRLTTPALSAFSARAPLTPR